MFATAIPSAVAWKVIHDPPSVSPFSRASNPLLVVLYQMSPSAGLGRAAAEHLDAANADSVASSICNPPPDFMLTEIVPPLTLIDAAVPMNRPFALVCNPVFTLDRLTLSPPLTVRPELVARFSATPPAVSDRDVSASFRLNALLLTCKPPVENSASANPPALVIGALTLSELAASGVRSRCALRRSRRGELALRSGEEVGHVIGGSLPVGITHAVAARRRRSCRLRCLP